MDLGQFVAAPCSWDPVAPAVLRQTALNDTSEWHSYSTARFMDGAQPRILHALDISVGPLDSRLSLELLVATAAKRWRSLGLEFASEAEISDMRFLETLGSSLDLIRLVPPLYGTVAGSCRSLHVLLVSRMGYDVSFSDPSLPFSIFVSCPAHAEHNRAERLAESLVHEALHLQLSLIERVEPIIINGGHEQPVSSPWREGERSLSGLLHAIYVFGNLRQFWMRLASHSPGVSSFAQGRVAAIENEMSGAAHILESQSLSAMGRRLATSFLSS